MRDLIDRWLERFDLDAWLRDHVAVVFVGLPQPVRSDLMDDPSFLLCDYEPGPAVVMHVPLRLEGRGTPARSVVLKRTLRRRPTEFVRYVIAHELAHAHLRNRGRWADDDPERAADALAAEWGFPRPGN
ncbi:MAG: ImmA/IrrE family metallo-endopeptidase [Tepidisphaeraceae bacterium]